ncbi:condensin-2 complex subunit H2-like [Ptychodera flava]|uniref:condensin-2 complex subunit H2-like n=1 Tax=Ptychodera flava TaxID=63121 RepID=UPI00396A00F2
MTVGTQSQGSQYSNYIQPLRDMAKNWEIDVASRLEEFLEELAEVRISFDGGETSMNFAEAALLIQGSTCVYSKKVESLYTLVYQALDMINSKKKLQQAANSNEKGGADEDDDMMGGQEEAFLDLDDTEERQNIGLKDDDQINDISMNDLVRTPLGLPDVEETEKSQKILISSTGEVIGSRMDYWMNRCPIDPLSGTTLGSASSLSLTESRNLESGNLLGLIAGQDLNEKPDSDAANPVEDLAEVHSDVEDVGMPLADMDDDDMDDGGMPMDNEPTMQENTVHAQDEQRYRLRDRREAEKLAMMKAKPTIDPWKLLDAHNPSDILEKPFRKAKTFKLPDNLNNKKRKRTKVKAKCTPIDEFVEKAYFSHAAKFPKNPLRVPIYEEFEILFWNEFKRRQAAIQEKTKKLRREKRYEELTILEEQLKQQEEEDNPADDQDFAAADDFDDDGDGGPVSMENYHDNMNGLNGAEGENIQPMGFDVQSQQSQQSQALIAQTYEDMVKQHVDLYLEQAQQYVQETDLSRRIKEWEEKIQPILQQEEEHGAFDIHHYGTVILDSFEPENGKTMLPFQEITKQREPYEVCRLLLASLQLANNQNVQIGNDNGSECHMDTMTLEFLSKQRHHEDLAEYRAPSIEHRTQKVS